MSRYPFAGNSKNESLGNNKAGNVEGRGSIGKLHSFFLLLNDMERLGYCGADSIRVMDQSGLTIRQNPSTYIPTNDCTCGVMSRSNQGSDR